MNTLKKQQTQKYNSNHIILKGLDSRVVEKSWNFIYKEKRPGNETITVDFINSSIVVFVVLLLLNTLTITMKMWYLDGYVLALCSF